MKTEERYHVNLLAYGLWAVFLIVITVAIIQLWIYVVTGPESSELFALDAVGSIIFTGGWLGFFWLLRLFPPYAITITTGRIQLDYVFKKRIIRCSQVSRIVNSGFLMREREVILKDGENIALGMVGKRALEKIEECIGV